MHGFNIFIIDMINGVHSMIHTKEFRMTYTIYLFCLVQFFARVLTNNVCSDLEFLYH